MEEKKGRGEKEKEMYRKTLLRVSTVRYQGSDMCCIQGLCTKKHTQTHTHTHTYLNHTYTHRPTYAHTFVDHRPFTRFIGLFDFVDSGTTFLTHARRRRRPPASGIQFLSTGHRKSSSFDHDYC